jgi:uncharacterized membrane protein
MLLLHIFSDGLLPTPISSGAEEIVRAVVLWLILICEVLAAITIGTGILVTITKAASAFIKKEPDGYERARLTLARFLALALEFQLAADVLGTAVSPSWTEVGRLAAIAVIRTALNYFLSREIKEEVRSTGGRGLLDLERTPRKPESE